MSLVLKNGHVFVNGKLIKANVLIEKGKITKIAAGLSGDTEEDVQGKVILPGMIDTHVHFREPGHEHKEDWHTGSMAAAAGGVTTVFDMPNNDPPVISQDDLDNKKQFAKKSLVNYGLYIGATPENIGTLDATDAIAIKVYHGSSTGTTKLLLESVNDFAQLMETTNKLVIVHSENSSLLKHFKEKFGHTEKHHLMRDNLAAAVSTSEVTLTANYYDKRLHIAHMSTKEEVEIMRAFKGKNITCEVAPHHLFLTHEHNNEKMNPPLRSTEDKDALWQAIKDGIVDTIATDHAPHTPEEKNTSFTEIPCGVPGVQTMLPLMLNEMSTGRLTLKDVVRLCAENPARIFGIEKRGAIKEGNHADLVVVDLEQEETITNEQQFSKCSWTPFNGVKVKGWPIMTIVNGVVVYKDGKIIEGSQGTLITS